MLIYRPYELPGSIKAAADCFAAVVECEGVEMAVLMVSGGGLSFIDIKEDDETHFLKWINGTCYELDEIEQFGQEVL